MFLETTITETDSGYEPNHLRNLDADSLSYQASSPDEMALVEWTKSMGLVLFKRDMKMIQLKTSSNDLLTYEILQFFPFTSESKRMGIIVKVIFRLFISLFSVISSKHLELFKNDKLKFKVIKSFLQKN